MTQMKVRVPGYTGKFPIWAWADCKPDLRESGHLGRGQPGVRIEVLVPRDRVLCSDFDAWHFILNNSYVPASRTDDERYYACWNKRLTEIKTEGEGSGLTPMQFADRLRAEFEDETKASWPRVFDLERMAAIFDDPHYVGPRRTRAVQAVIEHITLDEVVRVTHFVAR